ncbi:MAG: hypothetical protein J2P19_00040 [Pseudonocardia sp.]|nr:hypothetical protein [Pseudonocardia sp.]
MSARYPLSTPRRLSLDAVASRGGLHPQLVRRFVALSLLDATPDAAGRLWFSPDAVTRLARIQRLRVWLGLNYAGLGLVLDLLDRVDALEAQLRSERSGQRW